MLLLHPPWLAPKSLCAHLFPKLLALLFLFLYHFLPCFGFLFLSLPALTKVNKDQLLVRSPLIVIILHSASWAVIMNKPSSGVGTPTFDRFVHLNTMYARPILVTLNHLSVKLVTAKQTLMLIHVA